MKAYNGDVLSIDVGLWGEAVSVAMRPFSQATVHDGASVWTVEEAFIGSNGAKSIPAGTSIGMPLCVDYRNKKAMLPHDETTGWVLGSKEMLEFKQQIGKFDDLLHQGIQPFFMCRSFLKDELRKPGKTTRLISGTPLHYYILCRRYFGAIVSSQMNTYR